MILRRQWYGLLVVQNKWVTISDLKANILGIFMGIKFQTRLVNWHWQNRWSAVSVSLPQRGHVLGICAIHFASTFLVGSLSSKALQRRIWSWEETWTFQTYFREWARPTGLGYKALQMLLKEQVPANSPNQVLWDVSAYHLPKSPTFWHPNIIQSTNLLTPKYYPKHEFGGHSQPPSFDFQECTFDLLSFASTYTNFPALSGTP